MKIIKNGTQNKQLKRMYGHSISDNANKSLLSSFESSSKKEFSNATKMYIERTSDLDEIKISLNEKGRESVRIVKSLFKRNEEDFENDKYILASYQEAISRKQIKEINSEDFLLEIKARFHNSVRYAYKRFYVDSNNNKRHKVYIYHLYTIIIATLAVLNEIDFKPAVHISFNSGKSLALTIEMKVKSLPMKRQKEEVLPNSTEAKLLYLRTLCEQGDVDYTFEIINDRISLKYAIFEATKIGEVVFTTPNEEDEFFERFMNIFNGRETNIEEEE